MRGAISIYYSDNEGFFPFAPFVPACLTTGSRYLECVPTISIPTFPAHVTNSTVLDNESMIGIDWAVNAGWAYSSSAGRFSVHCTHTDSSGTTWSQW